jgi:hypothetical protein
MRYLIEYSNREEVSVVIDRAMGFDIVHGIVVRLDPTWLSLWRLAHTCSASDWKYFDRNLLYVLHWNERRWGGPFPPFAEWQSNFSIPLRSLELGQFFPVPIDPKWTCDTWREITGSRKQNGREPFVITVLVAPRASRGTFEELTAALGETGVQIRFEARPIARAYVSRKRLVRPVQGGISFGTDPREYATLGGILKSDKGALYALTCGHAIGKKDEAKQPSPKDNQVAARIGICVESTDGSLSGPATRCNRKAATNEVDAALIKLDEDLQIAATLEIMGIGRLAGSAKIDDVDEDSPVQVSGRSGCCSLYTGGLLVVGSLRIGTKRYCFKNLFEIKRASVRHWGVTGSLAPPVHPGDSGAWVIQDGPQGPEWCGMVVGGSGPVGYAIFAENILEWLKQRKYASLGVV